jgi:WD40 repeat protein
VAFSADGKWVASASYDRTVKLSDSTTGELLRTFPHPGNQVECVAIGPDGRRLASGCEDNTVRVWETATGREILVLRGHTDRCGCVAFSPDPDGNRLASASFDGTIRIWDATPLRGDEHQELLTFTEHTNEIQSVAISPDGRQIVSSGRDRLVKVWHAQTGRVSAEFNDHVLPSGDRVAAFCLAWHPQGPLIASGGLDGVRVWDARTGKGVFSLPAAAGKDALLYSAVAFSPDGRYLATGRTDGAVQVWDGETGQPVGAGQPDGLLDTHKREIVGVVFSKGGEHLASASRDGIVKLWDATRLNEKQKARRELRARVPGPGVNVAFSPDGRRLATGGEENTVKIWDVETRRELLAPFRGHTGEVYTLAFSPDTDGRWVASGGEDSAVKIWDSHTGKLIHSFRGHEGLVCCLAFSPDGQRLVSGSRDKTVKVWDMTQLSD